MKGDTVKRNLLKLRARVQARTAATLVEYTFILVLVSIAGVLLLAGIGKSTNRMLEQTNTNMPQ